MLTAKTTLGIALPLPSGAAVEPLRRAAEAGAGAVRIPGTDAAPSAGAAQAAGLDILWSVPAADAGSWERRSGTEFLEIDTATEGDRAALPGVLDRVGEETVILGIGVVSLGDMPVPFALPPWPRERVAAFSMTVEGLPETDDPQRMEEALRRAAAPIRSAGWRQAFWLTDLVPPRGMAADEHAGWLVRHTAHALALAMPRVFLRLPDRELEPLLRALRMLAAWLEGAGRVTWLARGQYRAEFAGRPSRFLLWEEPGITRLPSSFQGPLYVRDLGGSEQRVDTTRLKLSSLPLLVERRAG